MYFVFCIDPRFELLHMCIGVGMSVEARELEKGPLREFLKQPLKNGALMSGRVTEGITKHTWLESGKGNTRTQGNRGGGVDGRVRE